MQKYKVYTNKGYKIITDNWDSFCSNYILINAAGGMVYNERNQLLMIFRNNKWDFPKGKLNRGEAIADCAIREVGEETGVTGLRIVSKLQTTYHTYEINSKLILKSTYWFKMVTSFTGDLIPQSSEGITKVEWVGIEEIDEKSANIYPNLIELF